MSVFILVNALQWGLSTLADGYLLALASTSRHKATLLSVGSQFDSIVSAVLGFGLGLLIERYSYQQGFLYFALLFVLLGLAALLMVERRHARRDVVPVSA